MCIHIKYDIYHIFIHDIYNIIYMKNNLGKSKENNKMEKRMREWKGLVDGRNILRVHYPCA